MGTHDRVARHVAAALEEARAQSIDSDVVARCVLCLAIRLFRQSRPIDIAAELNAAADKLDEDEPLVLIRPLKPFMAHPSGAKVWLLIFGLE